MGGRLVVVHEYSMLKDVRWLTQFRADCWCQSGVSHNMGWNRSLPPAGFLGPNAFVHICYCILLLQRVSRMQVWTLSMPAEQVCCPDSSRALYGVFCSQLPIPMQLLGPLRKRVAEHEGGKGHRHRQCHGACVFWAACV
jgi:hypothetical protein